MSDEKLEKLYAKQRELDSQIKQRKTEIGREQGKVFDSIDRLVCKQHPDGKFIKDHIIHDSSLYAIRLNKENLETYICGSCKDNIHDLTDEPTTAYDCPNCGIVIGEIDNKLHRSSRGASRAYSCNICDSKLGGQSNALD